MSDIVKRDSIHELLNTYQKKLSEIDPGQLSFFEMELYIRASMRILLLKQIFDLISALDESIRSLFRTFLQGTVEDPETLEQLNEQLSVLISNVRQLYGILSDGKGQNMVPPSLNVKGENVSINMSGGNGQVLDDKTKQLLDELMKQLNVFEDIHE